MQRGGVFEGLHTSQDRQQDAAGKPEAMEGRQGVEHHPGWIEINVGSYLRDIGHQVALAQDHSLWHPEAARGEEDYARVGWQGLGDERAG